MKLFLQFTGSLILMFNFAAPLGQASTTDLGVQNAWQLSYQVDVGSADKTQIVGAYPFAIRSDGSYLVGPGPKGETLHGALTPDEFSAVQNTLKPVLDGNAQSQMQICGSSDSATLSDSVTLTTKNGSDPLITQAGNGAICSKGVDTPTAKRLHLFVTAIALNYYSLPFPSACLSAASGVQALYEGLTSCNQASDCTYLSFNYNPVADQSADSVYVDSCSVIQALPVANTSAVFGKLAELQAELVQVNSACGGNTFRSGCTTSIAFSPLQGAPVCEHNVCKINPSANF